MNDSGPQNVNQLFPFPFRLQELVSGLLWRLARWFFRELAPDPWHINFHCRSKCLCLTNGPCKHSSLFVALGSLLCQVTGAPKSHVLWRGVWFDGCSSRNSFLACYHPVSPIWPLCAHVVVSNFVAGSTYSCGCLLTLHPWLGLLQ